MRKGHCWNSPQRLKAFKLNESNQTKAMEHLSMAFLNSQIPSWQKSTINVKQFRH
jgi:hypothetical protein